MNQVTLIGNVGQSAEMRYTPQGTAVSSFSIATKTGYKENEKTQWWRVTLWGKQAESLTEHITKGKALIVFGELTEARTYTAKNEEVGVSLEVRAEKVKFQSGGNGNENGNGEKRWEKASPDVGDGENIPW